MSKIDISNNGCLLIDCDSFLGERVIIYREEELAGIIVGISDDFESVLIKIDLTREVIKLKIDSIKTKKKVSL